MSAPSPPPSAAVETDRALRVPARRFAQLRAAHGVPVWMYWFCWASTAFGGSLGSCHGLDIPFFFGNLGQPDVDRFTGTAPSRQAVADHCTAALLRLARTGEPGWNSYQERASALRPVNGTKSAGQAVSGEEHSLRLTLMIDTFAAEVPDPEPDLRLLWERFATCCDDQIGSGMIAP